MLLNNKVFLVTGASGGIGSALTSRLAEEGTQLILVGRSEKKLREVIAQTGKSIITYYNCDFNNSRRIIDICDKIRGSFPILDGLINVAGVGIYSPFERSSLKDFKAMLNVNIMAPFLFTSYLLDRLKKSKQSFVMNIGSGAGTIPMKNRSTYCASKFALRGLTLSLAEEFDGRQPKFCLITLGSTLTNFGGKPLEEKKKEFTKGQAYFPVEWVVNRLKEIIKDENRATEITLFPGDHGFGVWNKP
ncbi:MAG: SDR family oxidoreductase [Candidatus Gottesmanbacteria bacterium]|nr:SDR family oxidoreductase [Candidatus Gottesmanbacteria bacterium]